MTSSTKKLHQRLQKQLQQQQLPQLQKQQQKLIFTDNKLEHSFQPRTQSFHQYKDISMLITKTIHDRTSPTLRGLCRREMTVP